MLQHVNAALQILGDHASSTSGGNGRILPTAYHCLLTKPITDLVALVLHGNEGLSDKQEAAFHALVSSLKLDTGAWLLLASTPGVKKWPPVNIPRELATDPAMFDKLNVALSSLGGAKLTNNGDLIERLLTGPDDVELTSRELALLEAHLANRHRRFRLEEFRSGVAEKWREEGQKLATIRDFNRNLQAAVARPAPISAGVTNGNADSAPPPAAKTGKGEGNGLGSCLPLAGRGEDVSPASQPATVMQPKNAEAEQASRLEVFSGGAMVFFRDRVEFCGTTICGGPRCEQARKTLELLRQKNTKGDFNAFGSKKLAERIGREGGAPSVTGLIRDIRTRISEELRSIQIQCGRHDVIVRTKQGYQFKDFITVHDGDDSIGAGIQGHDLPRAGHNVPNHDDPDVPNVRNGDVPNVRDDDVPNVRNGDVLDVPDDAAGTRRVWILQRLTAEYQLQAPDVAGQFKCSVKTAQRDLQALKEARIIEFVGAPRTGHYRLKKVTNPR